MTTNRISIDPVTRLEGHGKIEIFLDDHGNVSNSYFQIPELRGFERFCLHRSVEEMPLLTSRICGVCPEAHLMASGKAADAVYHVDPPRTAKLIRELLYMAFFCTDHATHFYALGGPDFIMGADAPVSERNLLGVIHKVGLEIGNNVIQMRKYGHNTIEIIGGRKVHPAMVIPGGVTKALSADERNQIHKMGLWAIEFALFSLQLFRDMIIKDKYYLDLILGDIYTHQTYYMGLVDDNNQVNFYDGKVRVVAPDGSEFIKYAPEDYLQHISEHVEPWTYLKFPYLKKIGWHGFVDGINSGIYMATPLSRLNASDGMATPRANEAYEEFFFTLQGKPVHQRLATHWARLVEMLYAAEHWVELVTDPDIMSPDIHRIPQSIPTEGVGVVEAPRGTLTHHYKTDTHGLMQKVNLIVGTTNNYAAIQMSTNKAATKLITDGKITEPLLNMIEMAFRAYDPCFGCATHTLPGKMPLEIIIRDANGNIQNIIKNNL